VRLKSWRKILILGVLALWPISVQGARPEVKADKVIVEKAKRVLTLMKEGTILKTYNVSLGREPVGPKTEQGDGKTPEGKYVVEARNPKSQFYKSLKISYPNAADRLQAKARGVSPGGLIMIHGLPNGFGGLGESQRLVDWTDGCIAVTNEEMDEIWERAPIGTEVEIRP
jgi:murein L,D-transpeptidase YafK